MYARSMPSDDRPFVDEYASALAASSQSAGKQQATRRLCLAHLEGDYRTAWVEWEQDDDATAWTSTVNDGL